MKIELKKMDEDLTTKVENIKRLIENYFENMTEEQFIEHHKVFTKNELLSLLWTVSSRRNAAEKKLAEIC